MGWVRNDEDGSVARPRRGPRGGGRRSCVAFLREGPPGARVARGRGREPQGRGPRAVRDPRRQRRRLRRPGARRDRPPLRPAPRGRRGDALLGGAEGPLAGPGGEAPRRPGRGPLDVPQHLRGRARRGRRDRLGPRRLRAGRPGRLAGGARARPRRLRPARREAARRLRPAAHPRRREAAVAADQAPRRRGAARARTWSPSSPDRCSSGSTLDELLGQD